jgi:thymidylate synthase ThyX
MITAKIIADSINSKTNDRITTFIVKFPRFVNSELLRHRMLSFSSASSRAIPSKKIIDSIKEDPAEPVFWGKNKAGMQADEELINSESFITKWGQLEYGNHGEFANEYSAAVYGERDLCKKLWWSARDSMIAVTKRLYDLGLHKQLANRLLEPWQNITVLITGTEWENFFALRAHESAQPEIRELAYKMLDVYNQNIPTVRNPIKLLYPSGNYDLFVFLKENPNLDWHLPFSEKMPDGLSSLDKLKVACSRCARLSYETFDGEIDVDKDIELFDKLLGGNPKHASPSEHIAFPSDIQMNFANFKGWFQFRKLIAGENSTDPRVIKRKVVDGKVL